MASGSLTRYLENDPLLSGWLERFKAILGEPEVLEVPSSPLLSRIAGARSIVLPNAPSVTWVWRGFEVDLNGGGLIAEGSLAPPRGFAASFGKLDSASLGSSISRLLGVEGGGESFFNPLCWKPRAPVLLREGSLGLGYCIELDSATVSLGLNVDPLSFAPATRCVRVNGSRGLLEVEIAGFKTAIEGELFKTRALSVAQTPDAVAGVSGSTLRIYARSGELEFSHRYFNPRIRVLYPFAYQSIDDPSIVKANALVVETPYSKLAIASSRPLEAEVKPGRMRLFFEKDVVAARGGEHQALGLLLESLVDWRTSPVPPQRGPVHARLARALAYLVAVDSRSAMLAVYEVTGAGGALELRASTRLKKATLVDPIAGEAAYLRAVGGLVRAPILAPYALVILEF